MSNHSEQIKVDPEYKKYLERVRDALNADLGISLSIPDVTKILLQTKNDPAVIVALRKRSGRGGVTIDDITLFK